MNCYINNPKSDSELPKGITKDNTLFYPEAGMTTFELHTTSIPKYRHIITDSPFLISLYKREEVFIWNNNSHTWINPEFQTYACSYHIIMHRLFNVSCIPKATLDGTVTNCMGNELMYDE